MQDQPDVDNLLATARESILQYILPVVPQDQRLETLMVANALAIARRAVAAGETPLQQEFMGLNDIYRLTPPPGINGGALRKAVEKLNARLAEDIRAGVFDADDANRQTVRTFLQNSTIRKLRESNPKMLAAEGIGMLE